VPRKVIEKKIKPFNIQTKIMSAIRKVWRYSPKRSQAILDATIPEMKEYICCAICSLPERKKLAAVDHIQPIVPVTGFDSWDEVIKRLMEGDLQCLCEKCHGEKSKKENKERTLIKREKKKLDNPVKQKRNSKGVSNGTR
jgi:5-methylcytosine-specific restriction endonuclease McrA